MSLEVTIHKAQSKILCELLLHPQANYSVLQKPTGLSSDHFNFHIARLVSIGLVEKVARGMYRLSPTGKEYANRMDTDNHTVERQPKCAVIPALRRDAAGLETAFHSLEAAGCRILSPLTLDFVDRSQQIVHTRTDTDIGIADLEAYHLRTIRDADFVWLHAPEGVAGLSTAYEMGYAAAWHKPIFSTSKLIDEMLDSQVFYVGSAAEALHLLRRNVT